MPQTFKQEEVFPVIHRIITDRTCQSSPFITHSEIVDALLTDAQGAAFVTAAESNSQYDTRRVAANMVAWFSKQFPSGKHQPPGLLERQRAGTWNYRYRHATPTAVQAPDAVARDVDDGAMEGNPFLRIHVGRERSPELVKAKLLSSMSLTGRMACECCGFDGAQSFPGIESPLVEVHHRTSIWKYDGPTKVELDDLSVLCPTCHRAIHRQEEPSVEKFKAKYFPPK